MRQCLILVRSSTGIERGTTTGNGVCLRESDGPRRVNVTDPRSDLEDAGPLPRGRHGLPPEEVAIRQRERIVAAIGRVVSERGFGALTVERVNAVAGISPATFYSHFASKQEAVLAAHDVIFARFLRALTAACRGEAEWPMKLKSVIGATLDFAATRPDQTQMLLTGSLTVDAALAERIADSHDQLASLLGGLRDGSPQAAKLPDCTEEFLVAAIASVLAQSLAREDTDRLLHDLRAELFELTLIPYYGASEAARLARSSA